MIPPVASRFVAGETAGTALAHAHDLDGHGLGAILNRLGEHHRSDTAVEADVSAYCDLVDEVAATPVRACLSVKPTQLGLAIDRETFRTHLRRVVDHAHDRGVFVWVDMEAPQTVEATIEAFAAVARPTVGLCLQANLRRTRADLARLADLPGKVRLVKGAYDPPPAQALDDRLGVDEAYGELLAEAFRTYGDGIAVATHDRAMIDRAITLHETYEADFEFQLLMGVRPALQYELAGRYYVWQYVPFGGAWLAYFLRRVAERRANLAFVLRALVG